MLKLLKSSLPLFAAVVLYSCQENKHEYISFETIPGQSWSYADTARFEVIPQRDAKCRMMISIRHEKEYEFSNIWLKIMTEEKIERVDVPLFNLQGQALGKCSSGLCTQTIFWKEIDLKAGDTLHYALIQNMRKDPLKHIAEVGLTIDPIDEN
jgi:gliding motility-associated lipoprotein GldH